jgi:hypothetical protein
MFLKENTKEKYKPKKKRFPVLPLSLLLFLSDFKTKGGGNLVIAVQCAQVYLDDSPTVLVVVVEAAVLAADLPRRPWRWTGGGSAVDLGGGSSER